jgi:dipeptidyl-peptidase-4
MHVIRLSALALALLPSFPQLVAAQQQQGPEKKQLEWIDMFALTRKVTTSAPDLGGWLDARTLLLFAPAAPDAPFPSWIAQDVLGGKAAQFTDPKKILAAFDAVAGGPSREAVVDALGDVDGYLWTEDHARFAVTLQGDLFAYDREADLVTRITHGPADEIGAQWSPDGRLIAYSRDGNLYVATAAGGPERPLTAGGGPDDWYGRLDWVYQEELYGRGNFQGFWWSPDSRRLALLHFDETPVEEFTLVSDIPTRPTVERENYPKAGDPNPIVELGVVEVGGGEPIWFDLSRYGTQDLLIVRVSWHPDGKHVYFEVQEREQKWLDLVSGDVETGEIEIVLHEESPTWVEAAVVPEWLADGEQFVWRSEKDGWAHLYLHEKGGKLVRRLTEGEWEVDELVGIDEATGTVLFVGDKGDVKQNHLFEVGLDGSGLKQLTEERGWHEIDANDDLSLFVDDHSNVMSPRTLSVRRRDGEVLGTLARTDADALAAYDLIEPEFVQVETRDGFVMEAMLIKPEGYVEGQRYPVLAHVYGGPHLPRVVDRWRARDFVWHQMMAKRGYLVWVLDNRSASGKGRISADASYRDLGTSELRDQEDGVRWLVDNGYADPERIAIWGWSYGGYMTLTAMLRSELWAAGIAVNPVSDWKFYDTIYTERYMGLPQTNVEGYARNTLLTKASNLKGDLLIVVGTMDDNVHMQNSLSLMHELQKAGKQFRFMAYPRVRHGIADLEKQLHLFAMMTDFVEEAIGPGGATASKSGGAGAGSSQR